MDYGMIGKIDKARRYAQERERIKFENFKVVLDGRNNSHVVEYADGAWTCDCDFFISRRVCSHSMALERILAGMLNESLQVS